MGELNKKIEVFKSYNYLINFSIFIFKIILFILTKSFSFMISSFYNLGIGFAKKNIYSKHQNDVKAGVFLIIASLCFIINSIWTIMIHRTVNYSLHIGILIATVTFFDIGYAIVSIIKNKLNHNDYVLKMISLATAFISLELTQSALLSFTMIGVDNSLYNGIIGIVVGLSSLLIGLIIIKTKKERLNEFQ